MKDLTTGPIEGHVFTMAVPIFTGMIIFVLYQLVDVYFVSGLGDVAMAGLSTAGNATLLITALAQVLSVGTVALVSHAAGRNDRSDANLVFNQALGLSVVCGLFTLAIGLILSHRYVRSVAADAGTVGAGTTYLLWLMPALALQFAALAMGAALRGTGTVRPTVIVQVLSLVINIILAPVLISGWGTGHPLGVAGAGLATSIAAMMGVVMLWVYFNWADRYVAVDPRKWLPQFDQWRRILKIGLPAGGELVFMFIYMTVIYYAISSFGAAAQAGFGIGSRVLGALQLPALAIASSAAPIAGQNFGIRNSERVRETFKKVVVISVALTIPIMAFAQWKPELLLFGLAKDAQTIAVGAVFLQMISLNLVAQGLIWACSSIFVGLGNTTPSLVTSGTRVITYTVPIIWLSTRRDFRIEHVWYLSIVTTTLQAVLSLWLLRMEFKKRLSPLTQ